MDHVSSQHQHDAADGGGRTGAVLKRYLLAALALVGVVGFLALGVWQVERQAWKLDLIARVEARLHATPTAPPPPSQWTTMRPADYEYRRVQVTGTFLHDREVQTQALTEQGAGFWVLAPLKTGDGVIFVNRGFVPEDKRDPATRREAQPSGPVTIIGLMRVSEPRGGFLRSNDPAANRWYSRDVMAMAKSRGIENAAPFFIDADNSPNPGGYPMGGLTVVQFSNNHLVYALTWFGLALLSGAALVRVLRKRDEA